MFRKSSLPHFLGLMCGGALLLFIIAFVLAAPISAQTPPPSHTYYIHQDHLSSVVTVTDENGSPVKQNKYFPYGKVETTNTSINEKIERGYTGQIRDNVTKLSYYNARYYDPVISRFISADSLSDGLNRYAYVGGDPVNNSDPTGTVSCRRGTRCWSKNRGRTTSKPLTPIIPPATLALGGGTLGFGGPSNVYTPQADWESGPLPSRSLTEEDLWSLAGVVTETVLGTALIPFQIAEEIAPTVTAGGMALGTVLCAKFIPLGCAIQTVSMLGGAGLSLSKGDPTDIINTATAGVYALTGYQLINLLARTVPVGAFAPPRLTPQTAGRQLTAAPEAQKAQSVSPAQITTRGGTVIADPARLPYRSGSVSSVNLRELGTPYLNPASTRQAATEITRITTPRAAINICVACEPRNLSGIHEGYLRWNKSLAGQSVARGAYDPSPLYYPVSSVALSIMELYLSYAKISR